MKLLPVVVAVILETCALTPLPAQFLNSEASRIAIVRTSTVYPDDAVVGIAEHPAHDLTTLAKCPPDGAGKNDKDKAANRAKNRWDVPEEADINHAIRIEDFVRKGEDRTRFNASDAVTVKAYVFNVEQGSIESCNCRASADSLRDIHITLVADPKHTERPNRVIVEITPRFKTLMKAQGVDWSTKAIKKLKNHWVEVTGWLFFDEEHWQNAYNTNPKGGNVWRATCEEVHPVTKIELVR